MEQNYFLEYQKIIRNLDGKKPKLLLHVCCAPCSSHCLEELEKFFDVTVFYYNPNISPVEEYQKRLSEEIKFLKLVHPNTKIVEGVYDNENFESMVRGFENLPEGDKRCHLCYEMRLKMTGEFAKQNGFDFFTTTLTVSPYKNSDKLNQIGENISNQVGVPYLFSDFKKKDGYKHSIELSKKYNLYRQNYCGCIYSKQARERFEKQTKSL